MSPQTGRRRTLWDKPLYPHFEVIDAAAMVEKARKAGYRIVQEPRKYDVGTKHSLLILMVILGREGSQGWKQNLMVEYQNN